MTSHPGPGAPTGAEAGPPAGAGAGAGAKATVTASPALLRRIGALLTPYRGSLVLVAVAILVSSLLGVITPFLTQRVFDDALFPADGSGVDLRLLAVLTAAMIVLPLLSSAIGVGQTYLTTKVGNLAMADLRGRLFEHLERMELAFFTATKTGSIQSRLANDVGGVRSVLTTTASSILSNLVTVIASLVAMVLLSWQLTIVAVALMPLFVVLQRRVGARRQRLARATQESLSDMTAITEEALSVSGVLLAKIFNRADAEVARYRVENERQVDLQVRQAMAGQGFFGVVSAFMAITPALVYLLAGYMLTGTPPGAEGGVALTAGTLVAFATLQSRLMMPMVSLMRVALDVQTSLALFRRIFEYLDLTPAVADGPGAEVLDPATVRGRVEMAGVWFTYPPPPRLTAPPPAPRGAGGGRGGGGAGSGTGTAWGALGLPPGGPGKPPSAAPLSVAPPSAAPPESASSPGPAPGLGPASGDGPGGDPTPRRSWAVRGRLLRRRAGAARRVRRAVGGRQDHVHLPRAPAVRGGPGRRSWSTATTCAT